LKEESSIILLQKKMA